jgi:hypothetical protein
MEETFSIIIRSINKTNVLDDTNNCTIRLKCPTHYKYIQCIGTSFFIDFDIHEEYTSCVVELLTEGIDILNGYDSLTGNLRTIAFENISSLITNVGSPGTIERTNLNFKFNHFNNKEVKFKLIIPDGDLLEVITVDGNNDQITVPFDRQWVLVLKCKGYTE